MQISLHYKHVGGISLKRESTILHCYKLLIDVLTLNYLERDLLMNTKHISYPLFTG